MDFVDRYSWSGVGGVRKFIAPQKKSVNESARTIEFVVSTAARDRDGDIVEPKGWRTEEYMRNPVVLWAHDSNQPPVAKALSAEVKGGALVAVAQFPDAETYAFGDTVFRLYSGGYLSAVSAGFMPIKAAPFEADGRKGYRITEQDLWEFSAVPVPSNPEALVAAKSAGLDIRPVRLWLEQALDEGEAREFRDVMSGAYIKLTGTVHSAVQAEMLVRNLKALEKSEKGDEMEPEPISPDAGPADDNEKAGEVFTTGEGGEPLHTHEFAMGDTQTTEAGDPPHVHAVNVEADGMVTIGDAQGHSHEAPAQATGPVEPEVVEAAKAKGDEPADFSACGACAAPGVCGAAGKCYEQAAKSAPDFKAGRVLSKTNMDRLRAAREAIDEVMASAEREEPQDTDMEPKSPASLIKIVASSAAPDGSAMMITPEIVGKIGDMIAGAVETEFRRAAGRVR